MFHLLHIKLFPGKHEYEYNTRTYFLQTFPETFVARNIFPVCFLPDVEIHPQGIPKAKQAELHILTFTLLFLHISTKKKHSLSVGFSTIHFQDQMKNVTTRLPYKF